LALVTPCGRLGFSALLLLYLFILEYVHSFVRFVYFYLSVVHINHRIVPAVLIAACLGFNGFARGEVIIVYHMLVLTLVVATSYFVVHYYSSPRNVATLRSIRSVISHDERVTSQLFLV